MAANVRVAERVPDEKPAPESSTSVTVRLHKPIRALDKTLSELTFREPTARDIYEVGNPVDMDPRTGGMKFDPVVGAEMLARLAGIPVGSITNQMTAKDWLNCQWRVTPFFVPQGEPVRTEAPAPQSS
jgi:Phage tail assembly chaperone proteins, E, or 41 or 14